jgi:hypothetical protein
MSLSAFYTYRVTKENGYDKTTKSDNQIYVNKDQVVTLKDLTLTFDPEDTESKAVSKVTFSNAMSIIISQEDAGSLK